MKIVVAPDSFKECMSSTQVAAVMADAAGARFPGAEIVAIPLADGGEGSLDVLASAMRLSRRFARVHDPLGRPVEAGYAVKGTSAILEVAQAAGLSLLSREERNPMLASSRGVGELIMAAYAHGCRHFIVCLGGSATCDGGAGMLEVPGLTGLSGVTFELLCDVNAPFVGPKGAAAVFAPQKGASARDIPVLEERMVRMAERLLATTGTDVSDMPGAGAAGGLAGALMACFQARMVPGIDRILDLVRFDQAVEDAGLIITGEGKSDAQTLMGKVPYGVLKRASGAPVALLSGRVEDRTALEQAGFHPVVEVSPRNLSLAEAMAPSTAARNLHSAVSGLALADGFVEEDGGAHGNVEAVQAAQHGDADMGVCGLAPDLGEPGGLGAHDQGHAALHGGIIIEGGVLQLGGQDLDAALLEPGNGPGR